MGILEAAQPAVVVCTRDRARSTIFYRDVLGLPLVSDDAFAAVFGAGGVTLRVSEVADFEPHGHTMLGWRVRDVPETVAALKAAGVAFERFVDAQDERGILSMMDGAVEVAWFKDPDGNIMSLTSA